VVADVVDGHYLLMGEVVVLFVNDDEGFNLEHDTKVISRHTVESSIARQRTEARLSTFWYTHK